jgi:hypothetical protein
LAEAGIVVEGAAVYLGLFGGDTGVEHPREKGKLVSRTLDEWDAEKGEELEMLGAYGWAAQALEVPIGAEEVEARVEVEVEVEVVVWATARVRPAARTRVVSCMVYSKKTFAIGLERVYIGYKRHNISVRRELLLGA